MDTVNFAGEAVAIVVARSAYEAQDALEGIEISKIQEIKQIGEALRRIAEGTYGVCAQCGVDIDPKRL